MKLNARLACGRPATACTAWFAYDLADNRTNATHNGAATAYTLGVGDRLASTSDGASYLYNAAGCVTNISVSSVVSLHWNSQYQLTAAYTNGVLAESYQYDALNRRISTTSGGTTTYHVYDDNWQVLADLDADGQPLRFYTWGPGIDHLLAVTVYGEAAINTYYALTDHLGTVHALADASGAIAESYEFDAWGSVLAVYDAAGLEIPDHKSQISNRYLFQGREFSFATGLYHFRMRWYDPAAGRWLSNDPIGISGGLNQYVFCANNPVNAIDPLGLCSEADTRMQQIRTFIDAADIAADRSWWAPEWFVEALGAIALHGGPWSPLDLMANAPGQTWTVNGQTMTSPQFGNYLAGYYAGYAGSQGILAGMYVGGIVYAVGGNIVTLGHYGESWTDAQSVPFISAGFIAGSQARNPQPPR